MSLTKIGNFVSILLFLKHLISISNIGNFEFKYQYLITIFYYRCPCRLWQPRYIEEELNQIVDLLKININVWSLN